MTFHEQFSVHAGPIYGLCRTSFRIVRTYFDPYQTKNVRFTDFAEPNYVEFNCRKGQGCRFAPHYVLSCQSENLVRIGPKRSGSVGLFHDRMTCFEGLGNCFGSFESSAEALRRWVGLLEDLAEALRRCFGPFECFAEALRCCFGLLEDLAEALRR